MTTEDLVKGAVEEIDSLKLDEKVESPADMGRYQRLYEESLQRYAKDHEESKAQLELANKRITELGALLRQVISQQGNDLFAIQLQTTEIQNNLAEMQKVNRLLQERIPLTPEILDLVNKSKVQAQQSTQ